jgi:Flp pilus assembly protein TadD
VRTFYRAQDWHEPANIFYPHDCGRGDSARMLINLGGLELSEGHLEKAETLLPARPGEKSRATVRFAQSRCRRTETKRRVKTARGFLERAQKNPVSLAQAEEMLAMVEQKEKGAD